MTLLPSSSISTSSASPHPQDPHTPPTLPLPPPKSYIKVSSHTITLPIPIPIPLTPQPQSRPTPTPTTTTTTTSPHTHTSSSSTSSSSSSSTTTRTSLKRTLTENHHLATTTYQKATTLFLSPTHLPTITSLSALCRDFRITVPTTPVIISSPSISSPPTTTAAAAGTPINGSSSLRSLDSIDRGGSGCGSKPTNTNTNTTNDGDDPSSSSSSEEHHHHHKSALTTTHFSFEEHVPLPLLTSLLRIKPTVVRIRGVWTTYSPISPPSPIPSSAVTKAKSPPPPPPPPPQKDQEWLTYALYTSTATSPLAPEISVWKLRQVRLVSSSSTTTTTTSPPATTTQPPTTAPQNPKHAHILPTWTLTITEDLFVRVGSAGAGGGGSALQWFVKKEARRAHVAHMESYAAFFGAYTCAVDEDGEE
ncbi:hypothetical protein DFH27DRAFT_528059 [Peziza echinospora]|nr:hypothetical protein DFH27DRAFT_528059 [Peziza echinospora]